MVLGDSPIVEGLTVGTTVERRIVRQWELKDPEFGQAWRQARRQRVRDLAFDLVLEGDVPLIKALPDSEDQPWQDPGLEQTVGRIEIVDRPRWGGGLCTVGVVLRVDWWHWNWSGNRLTRAKRGEMPPAHHGTQGARGQNMIQYSPFHGWRGQRLLFIDPWLGY